MYFQILILIVYYLSSSSICFMYGMYFCVINAINRLNDSRPSQIVVNAKALSIMRCQDDINTEQNMKSIGRAAVAQWTKRLTRKGQTRVRIREAHIFDITKFPRP